METNTENIYFLANSLMRKLDEPIINEIPYKSYDYLPEYHKKNYSAIKEAFIRNYDIYKYETKEKLLKFISDMETARDLLTSTIPNVIKSTKIKDLINSSKEFKTQDRKWRSNILNQEDNTINIFDLKTINYKPKPKDDIKHYKENILTSDRGYPNQSEHSIINKRAFSRIDCENTSMSLQPKRLNSSSKNQKDIKIKKFAGTYRSPSPIVTKYKTNYKIFGKPSSKEKDKLNSSSHKLNNLSKINTPRSKRPWIPN